jgi:hypothetical protein
VIPVIGSHGQVGLADHRRDGAERMVQLGGGPTAAPRWSPSFLFVVLGPVGQRMALSLQLEAFTPVLHDVRPEPVAALVGAGTEDGRAITGYCARGCNLYRMPPGDREVEGGRGGIEGE